MAPVYCPDATKPVEEVEEFYTGMEALARFSRGSKLLVVGDFNAQLTQANAPEYVGGSARPREMENTGSPDYQEPDQQEHLGYNNPRHGCMVVIYRYID